MTSGIGRELSQVLGDFRLCPKGLVWFGLTARHSVYVSSYDSNSGGEREIQRTMLELLNQLDGFDSRGDVKVIMATNRIESLDPALIRPGRIDRKIEFPLPDEKTKRRIFNIHTSKVSSPSVRLRVLLFKTEPYLLSLS